MWRLPSWAGVARWTRLPLSFAHWSNSALTMLWSWTKIATDMWVHLRLARENLLTDKGGLHPVDHRFIPRREATNGWETRSANHCSFICFGTSDADGKLYKAFDLDQMNLCFNLHQALVYAIYSLCTNQEYVELLREEAESAMTKPYKERFDNMPLLDSFLRESARLNPLDARTCHAFYSSKASFSLTFS